MTYAKLDERHVEADGVRLRYRVGGDGQPLVLVHGLGGAGANWCELVPLLADRRRLLVPDLPGHGGSSALPTVSGLEAFADRILDLARLEGLDGFPVVGHSFGGVVALRMALRRPDAVSAVILAGAAGISSLAARARRALAVAGLLKPARRLARFQGSIGRSAVLRRLAFGWLTADPVGFSPAAIAGFLGESRLHTDTASARRALVIDDPRPQLEAIRCPCLVLWGAEDRQLPLDDAFDYARRLRARLRVIPDCGHLLIGERPDACADAILSFLAAVEPVSG